MARRQFKGVSKDVQPTGRGEQPKTVIYRVSTLKEELKKQKHQVPNSHFSTKLGKLLFLEDDLLAKAKTLCMLVYKEGAKQGIASLKQIQATFNIKLFEKHAQQFISNGLEPAILHNWCVDADQKIPNLICKEAWLLTRPQTCKPLYSTEGIQSEHFASLDAKQHCQLIGTDAKDADFFCADIS